MVQVTKRSSALGGTVGNALAGLIADIKMFEDRPADPRSVRFSIFWEDGWLIAEATWDVPEGTGRGLIVPHPPKGSTVEELVTWGKKYHDCVTGYEL